MTTARSEEKVCLVTGGGSGIGRAVALALANANCMVVVSGRREEALAETVQLAGTHSNRVIPLPADVAQADSVRQLFANTSEKFGRLDVLFNNAGIHLPATPLEEIPIDQWQQIVAVNLTGTFLCMQEAFRMMQRQKPQGGRIINNGSISAHVPRPLAAGYNATKHAVTGLTRSGSLEGRKYHIAVGQIDIGNAETPMSSESLEKGAMQADGKIRQEPSFDVAHVAEAVRYMVELPLEANVPFVTVMATSMPYIGRG
jgi:NAD(P)-dependent dehydrogenase (short-subunit alcohol dehydrogenase family)